VPLSPPALRFLLFLLLTLKLASPVARMILIPPAGLGAGVAGALALKSLWYPPPPPPPPPLLLPPLVAGGVLVRSSLKLLLLVVVVLVAPAPLLTSLTGVPVPLGPRLGQASWRWRWREVTMRLCV
jgi:hypothetical protein